MSKIPIPLIVYLGTMFMCPVSYPYQWMIAVSLKNAIVRDMGVQYVNAGMLGVGY